MNEYIRVNNSDCAELLNLFLRHKRLFDKNGQLITSRDFIFTYIWKPKKEITVELLDSYYVNVQYSQIMPFKEYLKENYKVTYNDNIVKYVKKEFIED